MNKDSLTTIGLRHQTDKATHHQFTDFYEKELGHLRTEKMNLLEIGILQGASLRMWEEFFENGAIYGADLHDKKHLQADRILIEKCNQESPEDLKNLFSSTIFDVIIDDGGHTMLQQQLTLTHLLPRIKPGGKFIMEDLHTSYSRYLNHNKANTKTTMELLTQYADTYSGKPDTGPVLTGYAISPAEVKAIGSFIKDVTLWCSASCRSVTGIITVK
jgi:hypothetical protein